MTTVTTPEELSGPSTSRKVTAAVATTAVTVVLGVASNLLIAKIATKVHNTIIPENEE